MTQLSAIQRRIASLTELTDVVGAMRALAGMRLQEAQRALPGIRRYARSVAEALGSALPLVPEGDAISTGAQRPRAARAARAVILCTAEHGFVGAFNERLLEAARRIAMPLRSGPGDRFYVLGSRGATLALERGWRLEWHRAAATRLTGTPGSVGQLTSELYAALARGDIVRIDCVFARSTQGATSRVECTTLLPLDTAVLSAPRATAAAAATAVQEPLHHLASQELLEGLAAEYLFARLTEAAVESLASENAARLRAMESARDNVWHKLDELRHIAQRARQDEITTELLDLIVGTEALGATPA